MASLVGRDVGKYHVVELLGGGGMAVVYKAFDTSLERYVAIKFIRKEMIAGNLYSQMIHRFDREAKVLASLDHPNIVTIFDYGHFQGSPYLVEKYIPCGELRSGGKPTPYAQAASLLLPVARALEYAHQRGIIHRDIKPGNILIGETGAPMLSDFGIAKILDTEGGFSTAEGTMTATGMAVGTPEYMAPEQWQGKPVMQSDIYALGAVFYELVTGRLPYTADTPAAVMIKQVTEPLPRPSEFVPGLPQALEDVIVKALAVKVEHRYSSMSEFAEALEVLAQGQAIPAPPVIHPEPEPPRVERVQTEVSVPQPEEVKSRRGTGRRIEDLEKQRLANEEKVRRLAAQLSAQEKQQREAAERTRREQEISPPAAETERKEKPVIPAEPLPEEKEPIPLAGFEAEKVPAPAPVEREEKTPVTFVPSEEVKEPTPVIQVEDEREITPTTIQQEEKPPAPVAQEPEVAAPPVVMQTLQEKILPPAGEEVEEEAPEAVVQTREEEPSTPIIERVETTTGEQIQPLEEKPIIPAIQAQKEKTPAPIAVKRDAKASVSSVRPQRRTSQRIFWFVGGGVGVVILLLLVVMFVLPGLGGGDQANLPGVFAFLMQKGTPELFATDTPWPTVAKNDEPTATIIILPSATPQPKNTVPVATRPPSATPTIYIPQPFPLAGNWSGTANNGSIDMQVSMSFDSACYLGKLCGTFDNPTIGCSGRFVLVDLQKGVYEFQAIDKKGTCSEGRDFLELMPDGELIYTSQGDFGQTEGVLGLIPPTATPTRTMTVTPTSSVPIAHVVYDAHCRSGPSSSYPRVRDFFIGDDLEIIAVTTAMDYVVIQNPYMPPGGSQSTCWIWTQLIEIRGSTAGLPIATPPPLP